MMNSRSRLDERLKSSEPSAARFICCALASLFLIPIASAQVTSGSITGTARDSSGAVIPGASITVTNLRTNAVRATLRCRRKLGLRNLGGLRPDLYGIPAVAIAGFTGRGENTLNQASIENVITFNDKLNLIKGRHNLQLGFEFQDIRYQQQGEVAPRGSFSFSGVFTDPQGSTAAGNALADYLLGLPNQAQAGLGSGDAFFNLQSISTALFVQEDWRITSRLTMNFGLRWQYDRAFREKTFKEGNFAEDLGRIIYSKEPTESLFPAMRGLYLPGNSVRHGIWDPDFNNFAPRFSLAWRPFGDRTVIRSGFGIFYENTNGNEFQFTGLLPPFYGINTLISRTDIPSFTMSDMFPDVKTLNCRMQLTFGTSKYKSPERSPACAWGISTATQSFASSLWPRN